MFIRFDATHERDRQTDTACRHIPRLCIASRGKKHCQMYDVATRSLRQRIHMVIFFWIPRSALKRRSQSQSNMPVTSYRTSSLTTATWYVRSNQQKDVERLTLTRMKPRWTATSATCSSRTSER